MLANQVAVGWAEPRRSGIFRELLARAARARTSGTSAASRREAVDAVETHRPRSATSGRRGRLALQHVVDTRALRGGPALRWHDFWVGLGGRPAATLRGALSATLARRDAWTVDDDSRSGRLDGHAAACGCRTGSSLGRPARRYERLLDNLQYVATADAERRAALPARAHRPGHLGLHLPREPRRSRPT